MPLLTDSVSCPSCCTQDSEKYWRVTGFTTGPTPDQDNPPTCTTTANITIDSSCFFGTPLQVLLSALSGSITVTCPGCPPLPVGNCDGGTVNYCGASNTYSIPAVFSNPARIEYVSLDFFGDTAQAIVDFEDCGTPLLQKDLRFRFTFVKCDP